MRATQKELIEAEVALQYAYDSALMRALRHVPAGEVGQIMAPVREAEQRAQAARQAEYAALDSMRVAA